MPEGDTVLRTANRLDQALSGRPLIHSELRWPTLGGVDLNGRTVLETRAHGKQILTRLAAAENVLRMPTAPSGPLTLRSHLRMEGRWQIVPPGREHWPGRSSSPTIRAVLAGSDWTAIGLWLGLLDLIPTADETQLIGHLGPDVLAADFDPDTAVARFAPQRGIGEALLDQTSVAGIGTMYMAETLFMEGISPWERVEDVDLAKILRRARTLLQRGVVSATPSTTGNPRRGYENWVHARSGRPCQRCGTIIRVAQVGLPTRERPAFWCPVCQPGAVPPGYDPRSRPPAPLGSSPGTPYDRRPAGYQRRR